MDLDPQNPTPQPPPRLRGEVLELRALLQRSKAAHTEEATRETDVNRCAWVLAVEVEALGV